MRIAFVSGNQERLPDPVIPLGLLYVIAATPDRHEKRLVDLCFENDAESALRTALESFSPDLVAVGMRNLQRADYTGTGDSIAHYAGLLRTIRSVCDAPIVMGGAGFSVVPRELMGRLQPDFGISGEAEAAFPALIDAIELGGDLGSVPSLHRFERGALVSNPPASRFVDLDSLAEPDRSLVDPRYDLESGIDSLQTSRGCPLRCDYCTYPTIEGRIGRLRSPEKVADEFERIACERARVNHVFIVDSVFNLPTSHAHAVCKALESRSRSLPWTCYANPLGFDASLARAMARAGCAGMEVGSDSGSDTTLERLRKGFTTAQVRRLHEIAAGEGIPDCHTFILGTPHEDLDEVRRTLDFIVDLDPASVILMVWTDDAEAFDPALRAERRRLREAVLELVNAHRSDFPWWSIPELGVNHDAKLFRMLRRRGLRGPLWQHARRLVADRRARSL